MEMFLGSGHIIDETFLLAGSLSPYDAYGYEVSSRMRYRNTRTSSRSTFINDSAQSLQLRTSQRRRQIPPRLRNAAANFNSSNNAAPLHEEEVPNSSRSSGLSEDFISETLQKNDRRSVSDEETCGVCLESIYVNREEITTLRCGHVYHLGCIKNWLMVKNQCALCRALAIPINER